MDELTCPLCHETNNCGAAQGKDTCWCSTAQIPAHVLAQVPAEIGDRVCVCERCATGTTTSSRAPAAGAMPRQ